MNLRNLNNLLFVSAISTIFCISATAQTAAPLPQNQINTDEKFELNIVEDRITENNFERSTSVALTDESRGNLRVEAGAGARAERIDVILRGITGRVMFRASLEPILKRIERLKTTVTKNSP